MTSRIKQLLKEHNISQRAVAERMGISAQALTQRLQASDISISTLKGIADTLGISLSQLCAELYPSNEEIHQLRQENAMLRHIIEEKDKLIEQITAFYVSLNGQKVESSIRKNTNK